jgi:hypothetical protein
MSNVQCQKSQSKMSIHFIPKYRDILQEIKNLSENLKSAVIPNPDLPGEGYRQQSAQVLKWIESITSQSHKSSNYRLRSLIILTFCAPNISIVSLYMRLRSTFLVKVPGKDL